MLVCQSRKKIHTSGNIVVEMNGLYTCTANVSPRIISKFTLCLSERETEWSESRRFIHAFHSRISVAINTEFLEFSDDREEGEDCHWSWDLVGDYWRWMVVCLPAKEHFHIQRRLWDLWYMRPGGKDERRHSSLDKRKCCKSRWLSSEQLKV